MRQYVKQHIEVLLLAFVLIIAMFIQYLRIAQLDIAFHFEADTSIFTLYLILLASVSVVILFFVFVPLLFITEIVYHFSLPILINLEFRKVIYDIRANSYKYISKPNKTIVIRC